MLFMAIAPLFSNVYPLHSISAPSSVQRSLQSHDKTLHVTKTLFHPSSRRTFSGAEQSSFLGPQGKPTSLVREVTMSS